MDPACGDDQLRAEGAVNNSASILAPDSNEAIADNCAATHGVTSYQQQSFKGDSQEATAPLQAQHAAGRNNHMFPVQCVHQRAYCNPLSGSRDTSVAKCGVTHISVCIVAAGTRYH